ncbi:MAG TPA: beta-ketoacyl-[acyl-carrier-protein] synthase family protein, partial [Polyangiales bacterium]|nr:beta-ketoacyl-[acyl-carrier-protein] synthase family protein [Polyangiales bacterium]
MTRRVFVTGMGVVSSVGLGRQAFWTALVEGRSGARAVSSFDTSELGRDRACEVTDFRARDHLTAAEARRVGRCSAFAIAATRMAVTDAGLDTSAVAPERMSVILGTTMGEVDVISELESAWLHGGEQAIERAKLARYGTTLLPIHVARAVGARGLVQTLPAACAAGNYAIGFACDQIRSGRADVVITGASEILDKVQFAGFVRLGAIAPERIQPFDKQRKGLLIGEGAGILVLESEEHALKRGATILAEVGGYGLACDAHHITRPHPTGKGNITAMRAAIEASGLTPEQVDFVNAHGTATPANDQAETLVMHEVFGARRVPISSIKSMIGHCMGAASALEAVACVETTLTGLYPPTINYEEPDPECDVAVVANKVASGKHDVVLNNSLAFGGYDAVVT